MTIILDPMEIYDRGSHDLNCLQGPERLVFMLQDFDNMMEMEGWDHFFIYEHHFVWYIEMKEWLIAIGDKASVAVLDDYERHLQSHGVPVVPGNIENFLNSQDDAYLRACPDWRERYCELRGDRWAKASAYLKSQGLTLLNADPDGNEL